MDRKGDDEQLYLVDGQPTIFHELLNSDLPPWEKSLERLWQDGQVVVGAGADTTANALTVTTFHLLDNPDKLQRLKSELETLMPDPCSPVKLRELEQLPYMVCSLARCLIDPLTRESPRSCPKVLGCLTESVLVYSVLLQQRS